MSTLQPPPLKITKRHAAPPPPLPRGVFPGRHHRVRWTILGVMAVVLVVLVTGSWIALRAISVINTKKLDGTHLSFLTQLKHIVTSNGDQLQGESADRVNILLLGYGGPGHDGPYLTDTLMVASFRPSTKQLALISIPRDLVVNIPGYGYRKINGALSFGRDQKYPGGGEALAVKVVSDFLNQPIQYYARVDFNGFKDVVDRVGGIDITVDKAFSDYAYPDNAYGYSPVSFKAGLQTMNGDTALKYTRSRHGNNGEGSDFARAKRQQKVIVALKDKLLSLGTLANPKKISDVLGSLGSHSQTNMEVWEMLRLAKLAGNIEPDAIINRVFDDSVNGFLRPSTGTNGAFILIPRDTTNHDIEFVSQNIFLAAAAQKESINVAVVNATSFTNLGTAVTKSLEELGLEVVKTSTLRTTTVGTTVLVRNITGPYASTEQLLQLYTHATGALTINDWVQQTADHTVPELLATPITRNSNTGSSTVIPDLIVVLGQDQPKPTASTSLLPVSVTNTNTKSTTNTNTPATNTNTASKTNSNTAIKNTNTASQ